MIKKKLLTMGLVTAMVFALTACGNQQAPVTVVTSNSEQTTEVTSEPEETTEPVEEVTTEEPEETSQTEDPNYEEFDGEDKEVDADQEVVDDIREKTGYDGLLVGTKIGISGKNVYVMIDGEGLLFDFDGLGMLMEIKEGDNLVGAAGMTEYGVIKFRGFCGETGITRDKGYKALGSVKVGELTVERYWNEEFGLYEAYCKDIDCAMYGTQGSFDYDSKAVLDSFDALVENNLKYFNANE